MVRIIGYKERTKQNGEKFYVLEVQGGIEMVQSKETGNFYATAKRATISSTFDEQSCLALIGTDMPGSIVQEQTEPYTYVVKETGEEITLTHRWVYVPDSNKEAKPTVEAQIEAFSKNGHLELASLEV